MSKKYNGPLHRGLENSADIGKLENKVKRLEKENRRLREALEAFEESMKGCKDAESKDI